MHGSVARGQTAARARAVRYRELCGVFLHTEKAAPPTLTFLAQDGHARLNSSDGALALALAGLLMRMLLLLS